jgi:magnesium-transporting ATPase (P-type)
LKSLEIDLSFHE